MNDLCLESKKTRTIFDCPFPIIVLRSARYLLVWSKFYHSLILVPYPPGQSPSNPIEHK
jgi:hypothetical protein